MKLPSISDNQQEVRLYPLWEILETDSLNKLREYQMKHYGTALEVLALLQPLESVSEIDKLMRQTRRDW